MPRKVILVGAGPGAVDLISVRGLRAVQNADVVVHDRLVTPDLLLEAKKPGVALVNVGKAPEKKRFPQSEINDILVALAKGQHEGVEVGPDATIVRLKGGDPFIFGLGGDEILALEAEGIEYEVVPGISSACAVPAMVGIPLTQKGVATSFTVISGHLPPGHPAAADWDNLPKSKSTLVVLMGVKSLPLICAHLVEKLGWREGMPLAVIQSGTTRKEVVHRSTLKEAHTLADKIASPCIIVIGDVCDCLNSAGLSNLAATASDSAPQQSQSEDTWGVAREPPTEVDSVQIE